MLVVIIIKSIALYLEKQNDKLYLNTSSKDEKHSISIAIPYSIRPSHEPSLQLNILNYSKTGLNSNMVHGIAMQLPLRTIEPQMVSNNMKIVKYYPTHL